MKRFAAMSLSAAAVLSAIGPSAPIAVLAQESSQTGLQGIADVTKGSAQNTAEITFANGMKGRITFLEEGIFRYNVDPSGAFSEYASPRNASHVARIQQYPDDSENYSKPAVSISKEGSSTVISSGRTKIIFDNATAKMSVVSGNKTVIEEKEPLHIGSTSYQTLASSEEDDFYGGGTQNGRINHDDDYINIVNESNWVDGGVASPMPFYWSTAGYGVLRNTFSTGVYDFGYEEDETVVTTHSEKEFDAYYFVTDAEGRANVTQDLLNDYFKVTGNPVLLPEYAFYLGHLNCYNRDGWEDTTNTTQTGWKYYGSLPAGGAAQTTYKEYGQSAGYVIPSTLSAETLNGTAPSVNADNFGAKDTDYKFSARAVIDRYQDADMPFGWFLPNDGYGCGYGQNGYYIQSGSAEEREASLVANLENLASFTEYANSHGVNTGLWTQSNLTPIASEKQQLVRDFSREVSIGGITTLKTDVAWVGYGYSFGLNGTKQAYDIITTEVSKRPNIVTLDGWAGTQRFGAIWTGDQSGGNWEYIRFHIPTYIGQSLAGNPNIGSDMDGIFAGAPLIATRDYQWKTFTPLMLDMDGWGTYIKSPGTHGDPYTGISRMYLKLKAQLMPYIYTSAASAANLDTGNNDTGLPMIRAMMLVDDTDYAASSATQYQYMFGDSFLVAPVYQDTAADENGNDIRNDIYLPGSDQVWIDYFTGKQYKGGQVLSGFDAPLWKLPLFVKNGAIIPMYEENNNAEAKTETNPDGLDKTKRIVEFYPDGDSTYTLYEDDGETAVNETETDEAYGVIDNISYGPSVSTVFTSSVDAAAKTATLTAKASTGSYEGYDPVRSTQFTVNVSAKPEKIMLNGKAAAEITSLAEFEALGDDASGWFYDAAPNLNKYAAEGESFGDVEIITTPKVYVKFAKTDVSKADQTAVVYGFENDGNFDADTLNETLAAPVLSNVEEALSPTGLTVSWNAVEGATSYEVEADGMLYSTTLTSLSLADLEYNSAHELKVRAKNANGCSAWSDTLSITTLADPWRNVPYPEDITWEGSIWGAHAASLAFDHVYQQGDGGFHSNYGGVGEALTADYGLVYQFERLDYVPRDDAGNGTVTKMKVEYSIDGNAWTALGEFDFARDASTKSVPMNVAARYVRMTPITSVGNYFSASEILIYKKDGTSGFAPGSSLMEPEVSDNDYVNMKNYLGLEDKAPTKSAFDTQIAGRYADINNDGVYGVYDYAFTMASLDGGTKQTGDVSGLLFYTADKDTVKAGDIVTVSLYGSNIKNANALGGLFRFDSSKFEAVNADEDPVIGSAYLAGMENLSKVTEFDDGTTSVNIAFANRGDKALYARDGVAATFQLRAKKDSDADSMNAGLEMEQQTVLVGPDFQSVQGTVSTDVTVPEDPGEVWKKLERSDLTITMTNPYYTEDDGSNVTKLIQQGSYDALFNGNYDPSDRNFELLWSNNANYDEEKVTTPLTMHFALNEPRALDIAYVFTGALTSNGAVKEIKAVFNYTDGTQSVLEGGEYAKASTRYDFGVPSEGEGKPVESVDITILSTSGAQPDHNLTLSEIEFWSLEQSTIDSIAPAETNKTKLETGEISRIDAVLTPADSANLSFSAASSDPSVAKVIGVQLGDTIEWFVQGVSSGTATITLTPAINPEAKSTYEVTVSSEADTAELEALIEQAEQIPLSLLETDSKETLQSALKEAQDLLAGDYTAAQVSAKTASLVSALSGLRYRSPQEQDLINKAANSGVTGVSASSEATESMEGQASGIEQTLDGDTSTYWHSNWSTDLYMPQWALYDLGDTYSLSDVSFLPRQNGTNGDMFKVEILAGESEDSLVSVGTWEFEKDPANDYLLKNRTAWKTMTFEPVQARFVKINVLSAGGRNNQNDRFCSMSEIRFYKEPQETQTPDDGSMEMREMLRKAADYADLQMEDAGYASVPEAVKEGLQAALDHAKMILAKEDASKEEYESAYEELAAWLQKLSFSADKSALQETVSQAEKVAQDIESWQGDIQSFVSALNSARQVLENPEATAAEIEAANEKLTYAMNALAPAEKEALDTELLATVISKAHQTDLSRYISKNADAFEEALKEAQMILEQAGKEDSDLTQMDVDAAAGKLNLAMLSLRLKADESILASLAATLAKVQTMDRSLYDDAQLEAIDLYAAQIATALYAHESLHEQLDQEAALALQESADMIESMLARPEKDSEAAKDPETDKAPETDTDSKDESKENPEEESKEENNEASKDESREESKDESKEEPKEETKDGSKTESGKEQTAGSKETETKPASKDSGTNVQGKNKASTAKTSAATNAAAGGSIFAAAAAGIAAMLFKKRRKH